MPNSLIRVLVCDASAPRRERLQQAVQGDHLLHVVGSVAGAEQAIRTAVRTQADVILLGQDLVPGTTVATLRTILQARAIPVVVVASRAPGGDGQSIALLEAGALAVTADPGTPADPHHAAAAARLREQLRIMAEVKVVRRWTSASWRPPARAASAARPPQAALAPAEPAARRRARRMTRLVAIGASTGGPLALRQVLAPLPASFAVPILIVQHMSDGFVADMAAWLRGQCVVPIELAAPGTELRAGCAYLAPDGMHMRVGAGGALSFDAGPLVNGHRPSVSCLFASVAAHLGRDAIGILLTGMGCDGAAELKAMRDAGAVTIAQDEQSSVVHGMPGEAIRMGAASYVLTPEEIGAALPALVLYGKVSL